MAVSSKATNTNQPNFKSKDNKAAREAADMDNYRTAAARICKNQKITVIGDGNIGDVVKLYRQEQISNKVRTTPTPHQQYHLPTFGASPDG